MRKRNGFTIVETLVVVVLIGVLGTVIITSLSKTKDDNEIRKYERQVGKITSSAALYIDTEEDLKNALYSSDGLVVLSVDDLVQSGLLDQSIYETDTIKKDTKVSAYLNENEAVEFKYDTVPQDFIKLTPVKESLILNVSSDTVNLVDKDKVSFCLGSENGPTCMEYLEKNGEYIYKVFISDNTGVEKEVTEPTKYVFNSAGHYAVKYVFKKNDGDEIFRYKYFTILDDKCTFTFESNGDSKISIDGRGNIFSNSTNVNYKIVSSSANQFYVTTMNKLTGQEIKSGSDTGVINISPSNDNSATTVYLYCFDESSTKIGEYSQQIFVDIEAPTCTGDLTIDGKLGNKVENAQYYLSNIKVYGKYYENELTPYAYKDNFGNAFSEYRIDTNKTAPIVYGGSGNSNIVQVASSPSPATNNGEGIQYYIHVVDAANNTAVCAYKEKLKLDSTTPELTFNTNQAEFVRDDNIPLLSLIKSQSDTNFSNGKSDAYGSGLTNPSVVVKNQNGTMSTNPNINELGTGKYDIKYTIYDKAGNSVEYNYPYSEPSADIEVKDLYLWRALRNRKICTGNDNEKCYVHNDKGSNNYITFAGKTFRAYLVEENNKTKVILDTGDVAMNFGYIKTTHQQRCCNGGCPYYQVCAARYFKEDLGDIRTYLTKTFYDNLLKKENKGSLSKYISFYGFNNTASNGTVKELFNNYVGLMTLEEYRKVAGCSGNTCADTYLSQNNRPFWTMTPFTSVSISRESNIVTRRMPGDIHELIPGTSYWASQLGRSDIKQVFFDVAKIFYVDANGNLNAKQSVYTNGVYTHAIIYTMGDNTPLDVRPVIVFNKDVIVTSGDGSITSPFVLGVK